MGAAGQEESNRSVKIESFVYCDSLKYTVKALAPFSISFKTSLTVEVGSFICKQFVWIKKNHSSIITYVSQYIVLNSQLRPSDSRSSSTYITKRNENYPDI